MSLDTKTITRANTYVLVYGAWHQCCAWDAVRARLEALGHRVSTPDLAGRAPTTDRAKITLRNHVAAVVEAFIERDLREVILVGHSMAGPIIAKVAEQVPERIAQLIFHDALVLHDGETYADAFPGLADQMLPLAQAEPDGSLAPQWELFQALWADTLTGTSPLASLERARHVFQHELVREPVRPMTEKVDLSRFFNLDIPTGYILCRQDVVFGADFWRQMAARLPNCPIIEMDGGHEALYTRPDDLTAALLEASQRVALRTA
jgi:pimeloyl-ACP methyl ester carboxylesterase